MNSPTSHRPSGWEGLVGRLKAALAPKYEVIRLLGHGGMAGVYLAREPRLDRHVAIKVISPGLMMDPDFVARFELEARTTAKLSHAHIVTVFEVDQQDDLLFIAMPYLPGRTVGEVMKEDKRPLRVDVVSAWLHEVGGALGYAHRHGVIHRDVKPGNILLDRYGHAMVTDFGIAKVADQPGVTRTGFLVGTPAYMSPEQCAGLSVSAASDQYSLGVVAYQMLTGETPFTGPTMGIIQAHLNDPPRPLIELRPDCPEPMAQAIARMLAKSAEERWESVDQAVAEAGAAALAHNSPVHQTLSALARRVESLKVEPQPRKLSTGEFLALSAVPLDGEGSPIPGRLISWASDTPETLEVSAAGEITALGAGDGRVVASCGGVALAVALEVLAPETEPWAPTVEADGGSDATLIAGPADLVELGLPPRTLGDEPTEDSLGSETWRPEAEVLVPSDGGSEGATVVFDDREDDDIPPVPATSEEPDLSILSLGETGDAGATIVAPPSFDDSGVGDESGAGATPPPPSSTAPVVRRPAAPEKSRRPLLIGGGALALVAAGAWFVLKGGDEAPTRIGDRDPTPVAAATPPIAVDRDAALEDSITVSDTVSTTDADPVTQPAAPTIEPDAPAQPPTAAPQTGTFRVGGSLPGGARVVLRAADGSTRRWTGGPLELAPGTYDVTAQADGYESDRTQVTIRAGRAESWSPRLNAIPVAAAEPAPDRPPPAAEPTPNPADPAVTAAPAIRSAVEAWVGAFRARTSAQVVPVLRADLRDAYTRMLTLEASRWEVNMTAYGDPVIDGSAATVSFTTRVLATTMGSPLDSSVNWVASLGAQADGSWRLVSVQPAG